MKFISYSSQTFKKTKFYQILPSQEKEIFDVLTSVFHFKVNNFVLENLIDWENIPEDPIYKLAFLRKEMLEPADYDQLKKLYDLEANSILIETFVQSIKSKVHPEVKHCSSSIPLDSDGNQIVGMYSNFRTIMSLFPDPMIKTCHSYCSYCFRWVTFGDQELQSRFSYNEPGLPVNYLSEHPEITDVIFTGADPLVLKADTIKKYIEPILEIDSIQVIRIHSKSLAWWPFRFTTDKDSEELLELFRYIKKRGKHINLSAHFTHPRELKHPEVVKAIKRIQETGALIRCQGPLVKGINDDPIVLSELWTEQIKLGLIPYYLFIEADHHSENCFRVPLSKALSIFQQAQEITTGLARTIRGPVFMNDLNRVLLDGVTELNGEKYFVLKSLQCPPGLESEAKIKLIPYDSTAINAGNLFELFNEEQVNIELH